MKLNEITPVLYGINYYNYISREKVNKPAVVRTHYSYRLIYVIKGSFQMVVNGKKQNLQAGSLLYMLPSCRYYFLPNKTDYSLISVTFDMKPYKNVANKKTYVNENVYNKNLSSTIESFDNPRLNDNALVDAPQVFSAFESLLTLSETSIEYDFHAKSVILYALSSIINLNLVSSASKTEREILTYIKLRPEQDLSCGALSKALGYSKNYINAIVKRAVGTSLSTYVRKVKISHAKILLHDSDLTLYEIADRLGYYDYSHFYKAFIKETGVSPTEYLR